MLAFPADSGNLVTFAILSVALMLGTGLIGAVAGLCCLLFIPSFLIRLYYVGFQLAVVLEGADGKTDLPSLTLTGGWWEDVIVPAVKLMSTYFAARLPATLFLLSAMSLQQLPLGEAMVNVVGFLFGSSEVIAELPRTGQQVAVYLLLAAGFLLWPMLVLMVAVGSIGAMIRIDLIGITIARSLPAYLVVVLIVYLALGIQLAADLAAAAASVGTLTGHVHWGVLIAVTAVGQLVGVYMTIIAMQAIGLYYHHFKHKFAWSWG